MGNIVLYEDEKNQEFANWRAKRKSRSYVWKLRVETTILMLWFSVQIGGRLFVFRYTYNTTNYRMTVLCCIFPGLEFLVEIFPNIRCVNFWTFSVILCNKRLLVILVTFLKRSGLDIRYKPPRIWYQGNFVFFVCLYIVDFLCYIKYKQIFIIETDINWLIESIQFYVIPIYFIILSLLKYD